MAKYIVATLRDINVQEDLDATEYVAAMEEALEKMGWAVVEAEPEEDDE